MKKILVAIYGVLVSIGEARAAAYAARHGDLLTARNILK
jgi:hypothetical protein